MKLTDRIKSKLASINLVSVAFFALSIFSIAFAWFAYTNSVSTNFQANVKTWKIKFQKSDSTPITNEITISVDDLYPGMVDFEEGFGIQNQGEIPALLEYNITYCRIFDEVINTNNLTEHELNNRFPFQISIFDSDTSKDISYLSTASGSQIKSLGVCISWDLDQGDDDLDTEYGNLAYQFKQSEEALHQANSNYVVRPSLEIKLEIKATQYVDETNSFATDSWKTIRTAVIMENTSKYHVGDTRQITIDGNNYTLRLANKSTPSECLVASDSKTACGFVIEFADLPVYRKIHNTSDNIGSWGNSSSRSYLNDTFFSSLPYELKKVITNTKVVSSHSSDYTDNVATTDKLYILSTKEIYGKSGTSNVINYDTSDSATRQLDYYQSAGVTTANYSGAIKKYSGQSTSYWTRSAKSNSSDQYYGVQGVLGGNPGYEGSLSSATQNTTLYMSPVFRLED